MSTEIDKPKAIVLLKDSKDERWAPFCRSLNYIAQVEIIEIIENFDAGQFSGAEAVFFDRHCLKFIKESHTNKSTMIFFQDELTEIEKVDFPTLNLSNFEEQDLQRILTVYLLPKRFTGVTTLLEKGSMLYGEKIQNANSIGTCLDKLSAHLQRINGFKLSKRILEFRQTLLAPIFLSLENMRTDNITYAEFQVGANSRKILVNIRVPISEESVENYLEELKGSKNIYWQQIRESADLKIAIFHSQYKEIELLLGWYSAEEKGRKSSSFLWKESIKSLKREELSRPVDDYSFQLISDIRIQDESDKIDLQLASESIDILALPEKIVRLLEKLKIDNTKLSDEIERNKESEKESKRQIIQLQKICSDKENLATSTTKNIEIQAKNYKLKISDLESQIDSLKTQYKINYQQQNELTADKNSKNETTAKLEQSIRSLENEKSQIHEKYLNEQKKFSLLEQKYNNLFKDSMKKDKDILDLRSETLKLKKESDQKSKEDGNGKNATGAIEAGGTTKIKDLELKELKLKQELKKALFKIESQEKGVKAHQQEFADKLKLMEQKLQAAKTKEIDLLKKIEELSVSLKKASKAA